MTNSNPNISLFVIWRWQIAHSLPRPGPPHVRSAGRVGIFAVLDSGAGLFTEVGFVWHGDHPQRSWRCLYR